MASQVLRLVCSCFKNAPASDTWDLSTLLVNGSPVNHTTVIAVLSVIYSSMGALGYEMGRRFRQDSLSQLLNMLLFADAVGCSRTVLGQLAGLLGSTARDELDITLTNSTAGSCSSNRATTEAAEQGGSTTSSKRITLQLTSMYSIEPYYTDEESADGYELNRWYGQHSMSCTRLTGQQAEQLRQQAAQQLEVLLFVGFKLDLQQLLQPALSFLRASSLFLRCDTSRGGAIFSQRVQAAAGSASGFELLSRSCVQQPLGSGFGINIVFKDVQFDAVEEGAEAHIVSFRGTLKQNLYAFEEGTRVRAKFNSYGLVKLRDVSNDEAATDADSDDEAPADTTYRFGVVLGRLETFDMHQR
jgi:hypothetical protein